MGRVLDHLEFSGLDKVRVGLSELRDELVGVIEGVV